MSAAARAGVPRVGQVLPHRPVGVGALLPEAGDVLGLVVLVEVAGLVVLDLVVVGDVNARRVGMQRLQPLVELVLGVAGPVLGQRLAGVLADQGVRPAGRLVAVVLVDVVAEVEEEVDVLVRPLGVGAEPPVGEVTTRVAEELHGVGRATERRSGLGAPDPADVGAEAEPVPVLGVGGQVVDRDPAPSSRP